jgi:hypothetical protein
MSHSTVLPLHRVTESRGCNACSPRYVGPLAGNGQISMFLDENGVMHDYDPLPARGAPRIYWAGRRQSGATRPLAPLGFLTEIPGWSWMESTHWEQAIDVHAGLVVTTHQRGKAKETTATCVLADRNLIAVHKKIENMRGAPATTFVYRLCAAGSSALPADFTVLGSGQDARGCWMDFQLVGPVTHRGRIALWADHDCSATASGNELRISASLKSSDEFTAYLMFTDDVGDDPMYHAAAWPTRLNNHPRLAPVLKYFANVEIHREDPEKTIAATRQWTKDVGWPGVEAHQHAEWAKWWAPGHIELPDAPDVQAIWETGSYAIRTQMTRWSMPVLIHGNYFNGQYFPDEFAALKVMLMTGQHEPIRRILDHKLSCLPTGFQMTDGIGARGMEQASYEGGYFSLWPNHTSIYEVHGMSFPSQYVWTWLRFAGMRREDLETYYPMFWGAAEFFRRWMVYRGPEGKLFTGACTDFNEFNPGVVNGVGTTGGAIRAAQLAADAAEKLSVDEKLIPLWREMASGLSANIPTTSHGTVSSYDGDDSVSMVALRLISTPFMFSPLDQHDPRVKPTIDAWLNECKLEENWAVGKATIVDGKPAFAGGAGDPDAPAWTWLPAEVIGVLAMLGDARKAHEVLREVIRCCQNFGSLYECKIALDGFVSAPWFVTSSTELSASICLMLMIPHDDNDIAILPAAPESWKNIRFTLWAMNKTRVSVEVKDARLTKLELKSPHARRVTVKIPSRFDASKLLGAPTRRDQGIESFEVEAKA